MNQATRPWVDGKTIGAVLRETAARYGTHDAMVFLQSGYRINYRGFDREVDRVARGLLALGLQRGDHFAVWSTNRPEWVLLQFATARIGVVLVTINPAYRANELEYALTQSEAKGLALIDRFKKSDYFQIMDIACPDIMTVKPGELRSQKFPQMRWVIALSGDKRPGMLNWNEFLKMGEHESFRDISEREAVCEPQDPINIQYTSGTTGMPKGATLSHRNLLLNVYYAGQNQRYTNEDRICIPVPLYHCFGCVLGSLCASVYGAAMIFPHEYFDPGKTLDAIEQERCTSIYGVPTMFIAQLEHESYPKRDLSSLRTGIMAGSPCPIELMKKVTTQMGAKEITIGYGQTEASPLITQTRYDDPIELRVGTVGKALPDVEVKIVDPVNGEELPVGQSGDLCARGHVVMLGYYNNPEATAKAVDKDGWLHTGDLAMKEPNGYFRITGRLKDMIIRGGENIYPREVEECIYRHPKVEEVQVLGVPDAKFGEEVLAWVKLRSDQTADIDEIRNYCRENLAHFKVPRYIKFVNEFPMTVTGKIQKFKIREIAIDELGLREVANIETA